MYLARNNIWGTKMGKNIIEIIIKPNDANQTIFNFIKKMFKTTSLSVLYKLFRNKKIKVNNKTLKERTYQLVVGDQILIFDKALVMITRDNYQVYETTLEELFDVVYEDENVLVVDKAHGVEIHSNFHDSLDNSVKEYLIRKKEYDPFNEQSFVVSHVHRIDKFTRGLVLYAKNKITLDSLLKKINQKEYISKEYLAKCEGTFLEKIFTVSGYINKDEEKHRMVFSLQEKINSKKCTTKFEIISTDNLTTWLKVQLITGRKHQIRATLSFLKHPIVNDRKYGAKRSTKNYMIELFAYKIEFNNFSDHLEYLNQKIIKIEQNIIK